MTLFSPREHPHGMTDDAFVELFTRDVDVVLLVPRLRRAQSTSSSTGDRTRRASTCAATRRRARRRRRSTWSCSTRPAASTSRWTRSGARAPARRTPTRSTDECQAILARHREYVAEHFEDMPEIRDWTWTGRVMILALNSGSSSLKSALVRRRGRDRCVARDRGQRRRRPRSRSPQRPAAVGHRLVHGGPKHDEPALVDDELLAELERGARVRAAAPARADRRDRACASASATSRRSRASTPPFTSALPEVARTFAIPRDSRGGRASLRLPRPVVRVHRERAARATRSGAR